LNPRSDGIFTNDSLIQLLLSCVYLNWSLILEICHVGLLDILLVLLLAGRSAASVLDLLLASSIHRLER
jgi:hypothetical protein